MNKLLLVTSKIVTNKLVVEMNTGDIAVHL